MNTYLLFVVLLACLRQVYSQCATNASNSSGNCLCSKGYYGTNANQSGGSCTKCPDGVTTSSPSNQTGGGNSATDTTAGVCNQCLANYYMTAAALGSNAASCSPCLKGSGNSGVSSTGDASQCNQCQSNYYMTALAVISSNGVTPAAATCVSCLGGSGNQNGASTVGDASACNQCQANYYLTAIAVPASGNNLASSAQCTACPSNSYSTASSSIGSILSCTCYDFNAIPLSPSVTSCVCKNGYQGVVNIITGSISGCNPCPAGQWSNSGSSCAVCALGSTISKDQGSCTCNDSSTGTTAWTTMSTICQCQENYYGDPTKAFVGSTGSCFPCPSGEVSNAGSTQESECSVASTTNSEVISTTLTLLIISFTILF